MRDSELIMKKKGTDAVCGHSLTKKGMERYEKVSEIGLNLFLTPDQHSVHSICPLKPLIRFINDPIILIKIIGQTFQGKKFDVRYLFQQENILSPNSRYYAPIDEVFSIKDDSSSISPEEMLIALTNLGKKPKEARTRIDDRDKIRSTLAIAEFKRRNGNLKDALSLIDHILSLTPGLTPNIWIIAYTTKLKCMMGLGKHDEVIEIINKTVPLVKNKIHRAMILQIEADILSLKGRYQEADRIFRSCIGSYRAKNMLVLQISVYNNMGVMLFRQSKNEKAEDMWKKALKISREKGLLWAQAIISMNLGDHLASNKGQIKRGKDMVRNAKRIMESINDLEGVADAEFNYALICIEEENVPLAIKHMDTSLIYPIYDTLKKEERIRVFNERVKKHGQNLSILLIYPPTSKVLFDNKP
jgi:tetratricopeptide (TPR) repeat protein